MAAIILAIGVFGIIMMSLPSDAWMELMPNSREFLFNSRLLSQPHHKSKMGYISGSQTRLMGTPLLQVKLDPSHKNVSGVLVWHALHYMYH